MGNADRAGVHSHVAHEIIVPVRQHRGASDRGLAETLEVRLSSDAGSDQAVDEQIAGAGHHEDAAAVRAEIERAPARERGVTGNKRRARFRVGRAGENHPTERVTADAHEGGTNDVRAAATGEIDGATESDTRSATLDHQCAARELAEGGNALGHDG